MSLLGVEETRFIRLVREQLDLAPECSLSYGQIAELLGIDEPVVIGTAYRLREDLATEGIEAWKDGLRLLPQEV